MVVTEANAPQAAWEALRNAGLLALEDWTMSLRPLAREAPYRAREVHRLDIPGSHFLVALTPADVGGGAIVGVDSSDAHLLWARLQPSRKLVDHIFRLLSEVQPPPEGSPWTPRLVWAPCPESYYSPFFPFGEFSDASQRRYVRLIDGVGFRTLSYKQKG